MGYKVFLGVGVGVGFAAGAWAGRDRYNAVMRLVRGFKDNPSVHTTTGVLQGQAAGAVGTAKRVVGGGGNGPKGGRGAGPSPGVDTVPPGSVNGGRPHPSNPSGEV